MVQRTLQEYLLILRERIWYIVAAFLVVFGSVLVYSFAEIPIYQSTATVEIFRRNPIVMQVQQVMDSEIRSAEDLNTQVNILKSGDHHPAGGRTRSQGRDRQSSWRPILRAAEAGAVPRGHPGQEPRRSCPRG